MPTRDPIDELRLLLRPAGGGLHLVSTGRAEQLAMQRALYGVADESAVQAAFERQLHAIADARVIILGVPSDVGAGFRRGANLGPQALRSALLADDPDWREAQQQRGVVDIGDVFVVPQLLSDDLVAADARARIQRALYPGEADSSDLPVAPLTIAERALDLVFARNPGVKIFVIGGDHSTAWPAVAALARARTRQYGEPRLAIVQPDAHTDLLPHRLGIPICFATWSYHANELIGRQGRLVQVGTRASRFPREHWESLLDVRQFWAAQCRARPAEALDELIAHVDARGLPVYFSNDIDGTDDHYADATGTPEPDGLEPDFVVELIRRLGAGVGLCGGDIMEVAPPLGPECGARTVALAARYTRETLDQLVAAARAQLRYTPGRVSQLGSIFEPDSGGPRGRDLRAEVTVPAWACGDEDGFPVDVPRELPALGGYARRVTGLDTGDAVHLRLPADFPDGGTLRLRGQGEASEAGDGRPGDLLLTVRVDASQSTPPPGSRRALPVTWPSGQVLPSVPGAPPGLIVIVVLVFAAGAAVVLLL